MKKKGILLLLVLVFGVSLSCKKYQTVQEQLAEAATVDKWQYIPVPGMLCRNGSGTGIGAKLNKKSTKLLIYLAGGGSCFNDPTCIANLNTFGSLSFEGWKRAGLQLGIFDQGAVLNPFKGWNCIYIPYCTGDVHSGTNRNAEVSFFYRNQRMIGYNNISLVLEELKTYYGNSLDEVLLTGSSAGGFGTLINADQFIKTFPTAKATVLDDSGPILIDEKVQPSCLDRRLEGVFKVNIPDDFDEYTSGKYQTDMKSIYEYLGNKYPDVQFGLVSALEDIVIREFYGYGANNCANTPIPTRVPAADYKAALYQLRDSVLSQYPNWSTCYFNEMTHTYSMIPGVFNRRVGSMRYRDWLNSLRDRSAVHVESQ